MLFARDGLDVHQTLGSLHFASRQRCAGAGSFQLCFGPLEIRLVGPRIDLEEHLTLADLLPLGEGHPPEVSGNAGTNLYRVHRLEAPGEFVPLGDVSTGDLRDRDGGSGRRSRRLGAATGSEDAERDGSEHCKQAMSH